MRYYILIAIVGIITGIALAGSISALTAKSHGNQAEHIPELRFDEQGQLFAFTIGGKEVMRIDAGGVHISGDLTYTGAIIDEQQAPQPAIDGQ